MKRGNNFFRKNQYKIATVCVLAAILGLTGIYTLTGNSTEEEPKQQVAVEETQPEEALKNKVAVQEETEETEQTAKVSAIIEPKNKEESSETESAQIAGEENKEIEGTEEVIATAKTQTAPVKEMHFDAEAGLLWPVSGSVILDYSMDQTVYFTTLEQYKYNPAVIISGNVNDKVKAAASGKIVEVSTNEVTGCTVTMDIGDGYTAIYGQLKEVPYEAGAYVEAGNTLGFVNEPTKYYALEGSNLYFALEKDGAPVDPVEFFQ